MDEFEDYDKQETKVKFSQIAEKLRGVLNNNWTVIAGSLNWIGKNILEIGLQNKKDSSQRVFVRLLISNDRRKSKLLSFQ